MAEQDDVRPIIIRRKIVKGGGHHGGAWKVAYADFVTAMMAFFLLMWLLNATTEDQRKGLADYFNPSIPVHRTSGGGDGPFGGNTVQAEDTLAQDGSGATSERPADQRQARGETGVADLEQSDDGLQGVADALIGQRGESEVADKLLRHVRARVTDEGLVIELFDLADRPLFDGTEPTETMIQLSRMVGGVLGIVTNSVAVDSHVNTEPINRPGAPGWQLTSVRALRARELLAMAGVASVRFVRVAGEADRRPSQPDPRDIRNRRTEIILIRSGREN